MANYDINTPPPGGFQNGGWYWDPKASDARQWWNGKFGNPGQINNPSQSGYKGSTTSSSSSSTVKTTTSPLEDVNKTIQDSYQKLQDEVVSKFKDYTGSNPFSVDQVLAQKKTQAHEQIDPYYDQILGDYLTGVQNKIDRGNVDTKQLLGELNTSTESYNTGTMNSLTDSVDKANAGYADTGLFGSGANISDTGKMTQGVNQQLTDYNRKAGLQTTNLNLANTRNIQDVGLAKKNYVTNLEQNRFTDVGQRAGQLTKEAGQQYVQGFQQTLPTQLQNASGFDMLKSLGIYG